MAFATAVMGFDWFISAYYVLDLGVLEPYDGAMMFCHGVAILWATMFFYNQAISSHFFFNHRFFFFFIFLIFFDLFAQ